MSFEIQAARALQQEAAEKLRLQLLSSQEIKLAVEILGAVLDELQRRDQVIGDLKESMTYGR